MIGENTEKAIIHAVNEELQHCIDKHGEFHNHHEAWAVLCEEIQEVLECFAPFAVAADNTMKGLWGLVRSDDLNIDAKKLIEEIFGKTFELAKESVQVLAMCEKWLYLIDKERGK